MPFPGTTQTLAIVTGISLSFLAASITSTRANDFAEQDLFVSGQAGYHSFRIPSIIAAKDGTLIALCEARKESRSDTGNIDLVMRRSQDDGKSWSEIEVVWDDGDNTCGNPCPVLDQQTGTIWMLLTWNSGKVHEKDIQPGFGDDSRRVFVTSSRDHGTSWAEPTEITRNTKQKDWTWYATGPGAGIQIRSGVNRGRLVIPCDHKTKTPSGTEFRAHVIVSDDHGATWRLGGVAPKPQVNECEVVELNSGRLLLNMRNYDKSVRARQICVSDDGGDQWTDQRHAPALIEPTCQASIRSYQTASDAKPPSEQVILFSNPASEDKRENMTVRVSFDDAQTWPSSRTIFPGPSAYSCLCVLKDGKILCLYEKDGYKRISLASFDLSWITEQPGSP
ncbi:MAG: sialidase family protein [Rubripirellula sp.]